MKRSFFIRMVLVCAILLAAEIAVLLIVFSKDRKKDSSGRTDSNKTEITEVLLSDTPEPTEAAERKLKEWEELEADDPKIHYNPEFREVWRVTGQEFYSVNSMFTWVDLKNFMEEPVLWSKDIVPEDVESAQTGSMLAGTVTYDYDENGCLVYYEEYLDRILMYSSPMPYRIAYDKLCSPLSGIASDSYLFPSPMYFYEYRYNSDGDVVHKWITTSENPEYYDASDWYPEYKYYYWNDGKLAKWEGYSADGELSEEVEVTYVTDASGRITEYQENSELRHILIEYAYDSNGVLAKTQEYYRRYTGWGSGYDVIRSYNEDGELVAKQMKLYNVNTAERTASPSDWEVYEFQASEDENGQRVATFMKYGLDGYAANFGEYYREYVYDSAGNVIERLTYMDGLLLYREEITYEPVKVPLRNLTEAERIRLRIYD